MASVAFDQFRAAFIKAVREEDIPPMIFQRAPYPVKTRYAARLMVVGWERDWEEASKLAEGTNQSFPTREPYLTRKMVSFLNEHRREIPSEITLFRETDAVGIERR